MTFDEQLQQALDTFTARLRDEVDRQVRSVGDEVAAVARAEHAAVEKAAAEAIEKAAAAERAAIEISEKFAAESAEKVAVGPAPAEAASVTGRLAAAIRALSESRSLSEVLDTLVSCAGAEAKRAGVLLVRGARVHGWRFVGFDASFDNAAAVETLPSGQGSVNVPLTIASEVVALLYADAGPEVGTPKLEPGTLNPAPGTVNLESVEILARFASQRLEALMAIKAARSLAKSPEPPDASVFDAKT